MSPIAPIISAQAALIAAIDTGDVAAIEAARAGVEAAVAHVRATGAFHATPALREELLAALQANDAARIRAGYHRDHVRTRLARVAQLRGDGGFGAYDRAGAVRYRAA